MPRFFISEQQISGTLVTITGEDAHHIARSLRMAAGEHVTVCDGNAKQYDCVLESFEDDKQVLARIVGEQPLTAESPLHITLYQALPKGDKLDTIIQKAVECGVSAVVPFESENCVVRMKPDAEERKTERRNRIALEAAKQCGRSRVPVVGLTVTFGQMLDLAAQADLVLFCYEGEGTESLGRVLQEYSAQGGADKTVAIIIGSEGGFSHKEAQTAFAQGARLVGLGPRILRTETASGFVLAAISYEFEL